MVESLHARLLAALSRYESELRRIVRFSTFGIALNVGGYLVYLAVTWAGLEPKTAVTVLYPIGVVMGYFGHGQWAFEHRGHFGRSLPRFLIAHLGGYLINISLLYVFSQRAGLPHQFVQLGVIGLLAIYFFLAYRNFVFPNQARFPQENQ